MNFTFAAALPVCLLAIGLCSLSTTAQADARQHFRVGEAYYAQGRYEESIKEFEEAYRLDPRPLLLFNIAQSYEKLSNLDMAVSYLKNYLQADPASEQKESIEEKIKNLEMRLAATGIIVSCSQDGAVVYVDGKNAALTPVGDIISMAPGTHKVRISRSGFSDFEMTVAIAAGQSVPIEAKLVAVSAAVVTNVPIAPAAMTPAATQTEPAPMIATTPVVELTSQTAEKDKPSALDVIPWTAAGVGAAAVIVGWGVIGSVAKKQAPEDATLDPDAQNQAHKKAVIADIISWPGLALAVGGTIWGLLRVRAETPKSSGAAFTAAPLVGQHQVGFAAAVSF